MPPSFMVRSSRSNSDFVTADPNHHQRIMMRASLGGCSNVLRTAATWATATVAQTPIVSARNTIAVFYYKASNDHRGSISNRRSRISCTPAHAKPGGRRQPDSSFQFLNGKRDTGAKWRPGTVAQPGAGGDLLHHRRHCRDVSRRGALRSAWRAGRLYSAWGVSPVDEYRRHALPHALLLWSRG